MVTPLRYALIFLLWAMVAVIYAPLIPAALTLISPALSLTHWQALFADPQLPHALLATLVSTTIAAVGALLIALLVIVALWPGPKWQRMCARLPWLLAIPHVAFATSALLLFADGGLLYDYFPYFTPPMDRFGIGLGLTLAVKESAFLLWILAAVLSEKTAVAAGHCAGFAGLQPLAMPELAAVALRRAFAGNGDAGDCCLVAFGRGCGDYSWAR